jgi:hypothetical protein
LLVLFIVSITGCTKDENEDVVDQKITVQGNLYENCDNNPAQNFELILLNNGQETYNTTNQNGEFIFHYIKNDKGDMSIRYKVVPNSSQLIMNNIPQGSNISNLNLYLETYEIVNVNLDVKNTYTSADTLYITNSIGGKYPGPFTTGFLFVDSNYTSGSMDFMGDEIIIGYKLNDLPILHSSISFKDYCGDPKEVSILIE